VSKSRDSRQRKKEQSRADEVVVDVVVVVVECLGTIRTVAASSRRPRLPARPASHARLLARSLARRSCRATTSPMQGKLLHCTLATFLAQTARKKHSHRTRSSHSARREI